MFGYLRLYIIACFITVLTIGTLAGSYLRHHAGQNMRAIYDEQQTQTVRQFESFVWPKYRGLNPETLPPAFQADMRRFAASAGGANMRVYSPRGILMFTSGGTLDGDALNAAQASVGDAGPPVVHGFSSGDRPSYALAGDERVRSFARIGSPPEAYLEIVQDVSGAWKQIRLLQWIVPLCVLGVFGTLMWVLTLFSRRAETIIALKHEENLELAASAASAQAENRDKSLFLANISHELRTPLNSIIGFSEIMKNEMMGEMANKRYHDYASDIYNSGSHLLSLINDILDFSKAEAGQLELEIGDVNISKLAVGCLRLISPRADTAGIQLINAMPKEQIVLETDGRKFKQILLNLLSNAVKFTPNGGKVRVSAWVDIQTEAVIFEVTDTGIGIAPKDIAKALAPFGQVDNTLSRKHEGTGLGLPLTRKFISLLGGKFNIDSALNVGTTVTFTLPRKFQPVSGAIIKRVTDQ